VHKRGDVATLSYREAGWPRAPNKSGDVKRCHHGIPARGDDPCHAPAVWKVEWRCKRMTYTAYYCAAHDADTGVAKETLPEMSVPEHCAACGGAMKDDGYCPNCDTD
jgi:hypothetical protein